jgi:hypothetical protein
MLPIEFDLAHIYLLWPDLLPPTVSKEGLDGTHVVDDGVRGGISISSIDRQPLLEKILILTHTRITPCLAGE